MTVVVLSMLYKQNKNICILNKYKTSTGFWLIKHLKFGAHTW